MVGCSKCAGKLRFQIGAEAMLFGAVDAYVRILYFILDVIGFERTLKAFELGRKM